MQMKPAKNAFQEWFSKIAFKLFGKYPFTNFSENKLFAGVFIDYNHNAEHQ